MEPCVYQNMASIEENHWWFKARREIVSHMLGKLGLPSTAKILEVGCGTGGNLQMLSSFGTVLGLEPNENAFPFLEKYPFEIKKGAFPDDVPFSESFDVITALDVIEHIQDDQGTLKKIYHLLKPGGYIIVTVPAYQFMWSYHDEVNHHLRRYRKKEIEKLFKVCNFNIEVISYYNTFLFLPILLARWIKNTINSKEGNDLAIPSGMINQLLGKVFSSEKAIIPHFSLPFGVSILAIGRKDTKSQ